MTGNGLNHIQCENLSFSRRLNDRSGCGQGLISSLDHLEFYVGNAKQAAYFYEHQFGFTPTAFRGLETGDRKTASYVMEQGAIRFVLTSAIAPDHPIGNYVTTHGDGVAVVAFAVTDVEQAYRNSVQRGALSVAPPTDVEDADGLFRFATVQGYGDGLFKFVERQQYGGVFTPGFVPRPHPPGQALGELVAIDHVVANVERGAMDRWVKFFVQAFGFELLAHFDDQIISTEHSALMSKVVQTSTGSIKLPINEPAPGQRTSQIEEYLRFHRGPGVQHIALTTHDIIKTVQRLKASGVAFLTVPQTYYDTLEARVGPIHEPIAQLAELGILADRNADGYLLQIFTQPVTDRPTLFFEIIERHGAVGFGEGNFKALFESIEREQARRGNL
ncbi:MAG: 4-hydroxyphenylpyruvate dioxygenase [Cyanobacteria bacterium P01_G01_bin.38]